MSNTELVKGYEFEKGRYVVVSEEDIQKVRVESTRVIDLAQFTDETSIDPIYVDRAYYLAPDGPMAGSAFSVMREGMAGKAGIGKVALYGREYLVAIRPQKKGLVMYTLHHDAEIRSIDQIEELNSLPSKVKPEEMKLAKQVIATFEGELNLKDYKDEYREGLRKIIDAKIAGEEIVAPEVQEPPKVVDLMEALRRSLDSVSGDKKKSAKAIIKKPVDEGQGSGTAAKKRKAFVAADLDRSASTRAALHAEALSVRSGSGCTRPSASRRGSTSRSAARPSCRSTGRWRRAR